MTKIKFRYILIIILFLLLGSIIVFGNDSNSQKIIEKDINKVLKTEAYSYLPETSKEYIKEVYEETGEIIHTEKNKENNKLYLNPLYVKYLNYTQEQKDEIGEVPVPLILDYSITDKVEATIPSSYDLRSVSGKNFVTPVRNQGALGICWTFASAGAAESYLLKTSNTSYNSSSRLIAERQMDYAAANNGIKDYESEYAILVDRELGDGGNFFISTLSMASGISLFDYNNFKEFNDQDYSKMELYEILSHNKSLYEVNATINMPTNNLRASTSNLTSTEIETRNNYLNTVKQYVMDYGAAYVGTFMDSACRYTDANLNNTVIDVYNCNNSGGHAMEIIGWNDNLQYTYCADNSYHKSSTTNCSNVVSGQGVWILKNSWGNSIQYPYLTYDSLDSSIHFITNMTSTSNKNWDNNYSVGAAKYGYTSNTYSFGNTKIKNTETIRKVKFISMSANTTFTVKVKRTNGTYETVTKSAALPGLVTVDIPNNVVVNSSSNITITGSGGGFIDRVMIFTSNNDSTPYINVEDYDNLTISEYDRRFYSETKNIPSGSTITYKLYNYSNVDVSDQMTVTNNIVAENNINTSVHFSDELAGVYTMKASYNGNVVASFNLVFDKLNGLGTPESPYIINNAEQLAQIKNNLGAYYELGRDIDLTVATHDGGSLSDPSTICPVGFGWKAINGFYGSLDGKGHTIKGLYQNNYVYCTIDETQYWQWSNEGNGLFGNVRGNATIKNLILEDFDITCHDNNCGALVSNYIANMDENGDIETTDTTQYQANFTNIGIKNSRIKGAGDDQLYGGGLFGYLESYYGTINIDGIYLDITRDLEKFTSDGYLANTIKANNTNISNIHLTGDIVGKYTDGSANSVLVYDLYANNPVVVKNVLSTVTAKNVKANLIGNVYGNQLTVSNVNILNNNLPLCYEDKCSSATNVKVFNKNTQMIEFTKSSNYSTWDNFNNNWTIKTIDGVIRVPVLNFMDFDYTELSSITLNQQLNSKASIYDYINPDIDAVKRVIASSNNENVLTVDEEQNLIPQSNGSTTLHVESLYDGFIKDIPITVNYVPHYTVHFNANGGAGEMDDIEVLAGNDLVLPSNSFTNEEYDFKEWNTKADGTGTSYANLAQIPGMNDKAEITLYAIWQTKHYVIHFDPNGGTGTMEDYSYPVTDTGVLPANTFTRTNFKFKEWCTDADGSGTCFKDKTSTSGLFGPDMYEVVLYAMWEEKQYTVHFDSNGGTGTMEEYSYGATGTGVLPQNNFTKDNYTFKEWCTNADGTGICLSDKASTSGLFDSNTYEITLYAIWEEREFVVHFNANGGTGTMEDYSYSVFATGTLPDNTFTRTDYKFIQWCTNADGTGICLSDKASTSGLFGPDIYEVTLYAIWESTLGTVTFNSNYGTNSTSTQTFTLNTSFKLSKNQFVRTNYRFVNWNTKADGTGTNYIDEELVYLSQSITLYAVWESTIGTVTFNSNYGTNSTTTQTFTLNTNFKLNKNQFVRSGYAFVKWNTKADGTGLSYSDEQMVAFSKSITLYAIWEEGTTVIPYVINNYVVDETNHYISSVSVNTDVNTFKNNFVLGTGYTVTVDTKTVNNKQVLYTGGKTKIMYGSTVYREFTNVVTGETSGDGIINSADLLKIVKHLKKSATLTGAYLKAGDCNKDNTINSADLLKIVKYLKGSGTL